MRISLTITLLAVFALAGCAETSVMPLSAKRVQILVDSSDCGAARAQDIAFRQAAAETIRRGFDRFMVVSTDRASRTGTTFVSPTVTRTFSGTTTTSGGFFTTTTEHESVVVIHMFGSSEPEAEEALDAREALGPDWKAVVASKDSLFAC